MAQGLTRAELTFLNHVAGKYSKDQLPHEMQIRYDMAKMVNALMRLDAVIKTLTETK